MRSSKRPAAQRPAPNTGRLKPWSKQSSKQTSQTSIARAMIVRGMIVYSRAGKARTKRKLASFGPRVCGEGGFCSSRGRVAAIRFGTGWVAASNLFIVKSPKARVNLIPASTGKKFRFAHPRAGQVLAGRMDSRPHFTSAAMNQARALDRTAKTRCGVRSGPRHELRRPWGRSTQLQNFLRRIHETRCNLETRPVPTHSATKMLPS